jgi:hypothetical protein
MEDKKPIILEMIIDAEFDESGVDMISFVDRPAIEVDFKYFNEDKFHFQSVDDEKRLVVGPAMVPNKHIIRMDALGNPYFVYFSEDTVKKANELYMKKSNNHRANLHHEQIEVDGAVVIESWLVEDPNNDKANALGFTNLPKGTWMVTYKVDNDELWGRIKEGEVLGFSIEGYFGETATMSEIEIDDELLYEEVDAILNDELLTDEEKYDKILDILK